MKLENARLQKQLASLQEAERIPLELAKHQPLLGLVGLATQAVAAQDEKIYPSANRDQACATPARNDEASQKPIDSEFCDRGILCG